MSTQVDTSKWVKGKNYPEWMDDIAVSIISKGYLLPHEDVYKAFTRVSKAAARRLRKRELQPLFYEAIEKNWLCLASPVLSNLGTERGMPISCFGIDVDDSIEGIADSNSELMRLSSQGGGVGIGVSRIRGRGKAIKDNGVSEGVVPWAKIFDSTILATNQGSVRRGAASVNLSIHHPDIEEFLGIRRPKGDVNRQCLNLHQCVVIDDKFMNDVENKEPKSLKLWGEILKTRLETGEPYIMYEDNVNNANPEAYKQLVLVWNGIRHSGSGSAFSVRLNNNSGSNYYNRGYAYNSVGQTWADNTLTHIGANNSYVIPSFGRGTSYAGLQGDCNGYMIIDNYASSTKLKGITTVFAYYDASAAGTSQSYASITTTYNSTSAITSVDIVRLTGSDTISNTTDTTIRLYGVA